MDPSKLNHLRQIEIAKPCPEDWDAMDGDDQRRFCAGCGCFVNNISAMDAEAAEELLSSSNKTCTRILVDPKKGILTRDGWIPRLVLAGAVAATVAGCSENSPTLTVAPIPKASKATSPIPERASIGLVAPSLAEYYVDEESSQTRLVGWPSNVAKKPASNVRQSAPKNKKEKTKPEKPMVLLGHPWKRAVQKSRSIKPTKPEPKLEYLVGDTSLVEVMKKAVTPKKPAKNKKSKP